MLPKKDEKSLSDPEVSHSEAIEIYKLEGISRGHLVQAHAQLRFLNISKSLLQSLASFTGKIFPLY